MSLTANESEEKDEGLSRIPSSIINLGLKNPYSENPRQTPSSCISYTLRRSMSVDAIQGSNNEGCQ